ncbi:MAG: BlaI/MecI/CopY family transcriptional regulator [Candidatus Brockarchaeota archaeon]|nr:BlaI/MecI/CopY family transcriptional regulator [Candidatus Brockarchaeota archaeon]
MVYKSEKKKLEIHFSDGSDTVISLRLEGSDLDKYKTALANLLPLMLSQEAFQRELFASPPEKPVKRINAEDVFLETLHKQGEVLGNILKVIREFRDMSFSSKDIKKRFEERVGRPIQLSTVATYLMRLHDKGLLLRKKMGKEYVYQAAPVLLKAEQ